ncbi:hypothetical protein R69746_08708 [Paraburkholderia aspalathi]|nr:hypothetical protein R75465_08444 [Paraburkholderia aspalathi]CAE6874942.1 hypothetical protein R69746_08708 [Paraburkholderia aspalathi]
MILCRTQSVVEKSENGLALRKTLGASDGPAGNGWLFREIAFAQEIAILPAFVETEGEKRARGLEITGLQQAQDLFGPALAPHGDGQLVGGEGEVFGALEVVELWPLEECLPLELRQQGEILVVCPHAWKGMEMGKERF